MLVDLCSDQKENIEKRTRRVTIPVEGSALNYINMSFLCWESRKDCLTFVSPEKGLNYAGYISLQNNEIIKFK